MKLCVATLKLWLLTLQTMSCSVTALLPTPRKAATKTPLRMPVRRSRSNLTGARWDYLCSVNILLKKDFKLGRCFTFCKFWSTRVTLAKQQLWSFLADWRMPKQLTMKDSGKSQIISSWKRVYRTLRLGLLVNHLHLCILYQKATLECYTTLQYFNVVWLNLEMAAD